MESSHLFLIMEKKTINSPLFVPIVVALLLGWFFGSLYFELDTQNEYLDIVEYGLGVDFGSPYVDGKEVITISPETGSVAEAAGLKSGDVLSYYRTLGSFLEDAYLHSGMPFAFEVMRDGSPVVILIPYLPEF